MKAIIEAKHWKQTIDAIAPFLTEVELAFTKDGMTILSYDSSRALLVSIDLPSNVFDEYHCGHKTSVTLLLEDLGKVTKRFGNEDQLELTVKKDGNRFYIKSNGEIFREFGIPIMSALEDIVNYPQLTHKADTTLDSKLLLDSLKDIAVFDSDVHLLCTSSKLTLSSVNSQDGEAEVIMDCNGKSDSEGIGSSYGLNFLLDMLKAIKSETMRLQFNNIKPVVLTSTLGDVGRLQYILAPKVERT